MPKPEPLLAHPCYNHHHHYHHHSFLLTPGDLPMRLNAFITPCCAALVLACAPLAASAQSDDGLLSPQYNACMDRFSNNNNDMVRCITGETKRQDARLNEAYKVAMALQSPERKKQLQAAQRLWIQFRDANCGFYNDPDGGTLARLAANDCVMTSTAQRAKELEGFAPQR